MIYKTYSHFARIDSKIDWKKNKKQSTKFTFDEQKTKNIINV